MDNFEFQYNTSKDYDKLFELIQTQRIVCFVNYEKKISDTKTVKLTDICANRLGIEDEHISIGARGIEYIHAFPFNGLTLKEDFIKQCSEYSLEFIEPTN